MGCKEKDAIAINAEADGFYLDYVGCKVQMLYYRPRTIFCFISTMWDVKIKIYIMLWSLVKVLSRLCGM